MSDNPRPVTYGARYEAFLPAQAAAPRPSVSTSPASTASRATFWSRTHICLPISRSATCSPPRSPGAYGYSMASNYNLLPRPAVVFVHDGDARLVVRRETYEDLVTRDHMGD